MLATPPFNPELSAYTLLLGDKTTGNTEVPQVESARVLPLHKQTVITLSNTKCSETPSTIKSAGHCDAGNEHVAQTSAICTFRRLMTAGRKQTNPFIIQMAYAIVTSSLLIKAVKGNCTIRILFICTYLLPLIANANYKGRI